MEVNGSKQLSRHAVSVAMIVTALMFLPVTAAVSYGNAGSQALLDGLTRRVITVHPTTNGRADITLNGSDSAVPPAGSYLNGGLDQAGRKTQLWLQLQR